MWGNFVTSTLINYALSDLKKNGFSASILIIVHAACTRAGTCYSPGNANSSLHLQVFPTLWG